MPYISATAVVAAVGSAAIAFAATATAHPVAQGGHHTPAAATATAPLTSRTVTLPGGVAVTFGLSDVAGHGQPSLNGAPTTRQVILDDTAFARITGAAQGVVTVGYQAACAVDVTPMLDLNAGATLGGSVDSGVDAEPGILGPSVGGEVGPAVQAGISGDLEVTPGSGKTEVIDTGPVSSGRLVSFVSNNVSLEADGCGGSLTVRPFVTMVVTTPAEHYRDTVYANPFTV